MTGKPPPTGPVARGPNATRRLATREKILAAAVNSLNEAGYAQTSTVRVAAVARVARGSLLHQFPARIDLILAVADYTAKAQGEFIREGLARIPAGRERYLASIDVTWAAFQRPESRALLEIIVATRYDPELAARIPDFAQRFDAGVARGAHRFAEASGLRDDLGEAAAERRLILVALRGLAVEMTLSGGAADPEPVLALLRRVRAEFFDSHLAAGNGQA
ncbi:MAG TPA: TetR family transcriptional regulator [Caulobacteraceae bacterium]|jgi:AcrR family transcriptional regulator|nr:TetR family transcriptional regulator [Caulobacteraceae bacterium]